MRSPRIHGFDGSHPRLELLLEIHREISFERNMARLPSLVMTSVGRLMDADRSTLFLFDGDTMSLRACFAQGIEAADPLVVPLRTGVVGAALLQRQAVNLINASHHPFFNPQIDSATGHRTDSLLAVPIVDPESGQILGGIELLDKPTGRFTSEDERAVAEAANAIGERMRRPGFDARAARAEIEALHGRIEFGRGALFGLNSATGHLAAIHADGISGVEISMNLRLGIAGLVAMTKAPLLIADAHSDPRFDASFDCHTGYFTRQILCVPLLDSANESMGVIEVINKRTGKFSHDDLALLVSVAGIVSVAIENATIFEESERQFRSLLNALAASIDARDCLTAGHSRRVAEIARGIAKELDFTEYDIDLLEVAAILHDYGKIGIDDRVLKKKGSLDQHEYVHMKRHAQLSFEILEKIHFSRRYRAVPLIASSHHENLDGTGYPRGLKAYEIPFMAKILSVADVFEALTADRHYRKGMQVNRALAIIEQDIGNKFEERIVAALRRYLVRGGLVALNLTMRRDDTSHAIAA